MTIAFGLLLPPTALAQGTPPSPPAQVVVFALGGNFVIRVVDPDLLEHIWEIVTFQRPPQIVAGTVATGNGGYNRPPGGGPAWSWHMWEETIVLTDYAVEICDATTQYVEDHIQSWVGGEFCPWSSYPIAIIPDSWILADTDVDGDVDGQDAALVESCFTGADQFCWDTGPGCCAADLDADRDVDCDDFARVASDWTEPGVPDTPPLCQAAPAVPALAARARLFTSIAILAIGLGLAARGFVRGPAVQA